MYFLLSILLGLIPEVLYFTLFLVYTKNLETKRIKLFLLISIAYLISVMLSRFVIIYYLLFLILIYAILKLLYKKKTQIIDVFIIGLAYFWVTFLSFIIIKFANKDFSNYYILYIINRILLFLPFIFKNKFNKIYKKYYEFWNRDYSNNRVIKSITLRNISLILLNGFIFLINITIINIINFSK